MNTVTISVPPNLSISEIVHWWNDRLEEQPDYLLEVDASQVPSEFSRGFSELVGACGHRVKGGTSGNFGPFLSSTFLTVETIFADTEVRPEPLDRLLTRFRATVDSLVAQDVPEDVCCLSIIYCSVDKSLELFSIAQMIVEANTQGRRISFLLVPYSHPAEGYPEPSNGHIDARVLPNKYYADRARGLFDRAFSRILLESRVDWTTCIRMAIDDDDVWTPWAVREIVRHAHAILETNGRSVRAIGLSKQHIYYPLESGRLDRVDLEVCLTGSKFFVSKSWNSVANLTPWMLPERFSANVVRSYRRQGIDLRVVRNSLPFLIYIRSRFSLSKMMKTEHYLGEPTVVMGVGESCFAVKAAELMQMESSIDCVEPVFEIDPPSLTVNATFDESNESLTVNGNFEEFLSHKGLTLEDGLRIFVNGGSNGQRYDLTKLSESPLRFLARNLTERTILRIENVDGTVVGSAWVRGKEGFLS